MLRSHNRVPLLALAAACSLAAACGRDAALAACEADRTLAVLNDGPGRWAEQQLQPQLVEVWRAGASAAGPEFGYPAAIAVSPSGRIAVADFERDEVFVLAPDGSWLGSWPTGERLGKPVAVGWGARESLQIFDLGASSLVITDPEGNLENQQPLAEAFLAAAMQGGGLDWAAVLPGGTVYFQPMAALDPESDDPGSSHWTIWRQQAGNPRVDTIAQAPARLFGYTMRSQLPIPSWPRLRAATAGGQLAIGGEDARYRIRIYGENGQPIRTVCRTARPLPLTAEERGEAGPEEVAELVREAPRPASPAPFGHLFLSAGGELWVQRDRPSIVAADPLTAVHGNPGGLFDVFDSEGRFLGELRAPEAVRLRAAAGDRVIGLEYSEAEGVQLVVYQLGLTLYSARSATIGSTRVARRAGR